MTWENKVSFNSVLSQ